MRLSRGIGIQVCLAQAVLVYEENWRQDTGLGVVVATTLASRSATTLLRYFRRNQQLQAWRLYSIGSFLLTHLRAGKDEE